MVQREANLRGLLISIALYVLLLGVLLAVAGRDILVILGF